MMPPTSIDGTDITGATIDGQDVQEITVDGQTVFSATPDIPESVENHWPIDGDDASVTTDAVGQIDLNVSGASLINDSGSASGHHYALDGSDFLTLADPNDDSNFFNLDEFTFIIWVKMAEANQNFGFLPFGHVNSTTGLSVNSNSWTVNVVSSNEWRVQISGELAFTGDYTSDFLTDEWVMMTLRFDNGTMDLLKNDANLVDSGTTSANNTGDNGDEFAIGAHPDGGNGMVGDIDFGGFTQSAISDSDISQYYNAHPRS